MKTFGRQHLKRLSLPLITPEMTARIAAIYGRVPLLICKGLCHESCGLVMNEMSQVEYSRIVTTLGKRPDRSKDSLTCSLLSDAKRCTVYPVRPLICRLFGVVKKMACPFGCVPERWLPDEEAHRMLKEMEALNG